MEDQSGESLELLVKVHPNPSKKTENYVTVKFCCTHDFADGN